MNFRRIKGIAWKESIHVLRDPWSLVMALGTPILMLTLFGYALTLDVDHVPIVILDWDKTPLSRQLISKFQGSRYFSIKDQGLHSLSEIDHAIDRREAVLALVIPVNFEETVNRGEPIAVQLIADGSDSNTATLAIGYAEAILTSFSRVSKETIFRKINKPIIKGPLDARIRVWFNPDLESRINIVPNLIATIMMVVGALLTSLTIAREWERGTMEQLISTPVTRGELFIGKLFPYFLIGVADILVVMQLGQFIFQVPLRGSALLLMFIATIFLIGSLCLGMFISIIAKNQVVATQIAMVSTFLPSFLLSGFITPIDNMPYFIQLVSYAVPARYFITILRDIYLKGAGLYTLYDELIFLLVFCALVIGLSLFSFKKKLD